MFRGVGPYGVLPVYTLGIIAVSVMPPSGGTPAWNFDKVGHYLAYAGLGMLVCFALRGSAERVWGLLGAVGLGAVLELVQSQIPGWDMSLADGVVNTVGVLTGLVLFSLRERDVRRMARVIFRGQGWE